MVIHFSSGKERLEYIRGKFEKIEPVEAKEEPKKKPRKKKEVKKDEVQA